MNTLERKAKFQEEENEVLKQILELVFFRTWRNEGQNKLTFNNFAHERLLELFITPFCNQHCDYCYLVKYQEKLYPKEIVNQEQILNNLIILTNYLIENDFKITEIHLFSGEIWQTPFGIRFLEILLEQITKGLQIKSVVIPSNCTFILNDKQTRQIERLIDAYNAANVCLMFSISVDGAPIEKSSRPLNTSIDNRTDEFYDKLFTFAREKNFCFHPMVSATNVKSWANENLDWWIETLKKHGLSLDKIMTLEVRNDNWTDEAIADYGKFLDRLIEIDLAETSDYGLDAFICSLLGDPSGPQHHEAGGAYKPEFLPASDTFAGCTVSHAMTVRLGDLAICPCHRTCYNKYIYGFFKVENNKIVDIIANNPQMAERIYFVHNKNGSIKCDTCPYKELCLQGCFGQQLEHNGDPFIPIENVCNFFRHKYSHLIKRYYELGLIDYLKSITPQQIGYDRASSLLQTIERLENAHALVE